MDEGIYLKEKENQLTVIELKRKILNQKANIVRAT
jgi:hypothetical protein